MSDSNQNSCTPEGDNTPNLSELFGYSEDAHNVNRLYFSYILDHNENSESNSNTSALNNNNNNNRNYLISNLFNKQKKNRRKFDPDSLRKKIKQLILKYSLEFINRKIYTLFNKKNEQKNRR